MSPAWRSARSRVLLTCSPSPAVATGPTTSTPNPRRAPSVRRLPRPRHRAPDDRLVAQVRAVEVAERENAAREPLGPAREVANDAHRHHIIYMTPPDGRRLGARHAGPGSAYGPRRRGGEDRRG